MRLLALLILLPALLWLARPLTALMYGDAVAAGIGVPVGRVRVLSLFVGVLLVAMATATTGPVAFVALAAPHICRTLTRVTGAGLAGAALAAAVCLVLLGVLAPRMAPVLPSGVVAETGRSRVLAVAERAVPEPVDRAADDLQAAVGEVVSGLPPLRAPVPPDRTDVVRA